MNRLAVLRSVMLTVLVGAQSSAFGATIAGTVRDATGKPLKAYTSTTSASYSWLRRGRQGIISGSGATYSYGTPSSSIAWLSLLHSTSMFCDVYLIGLTRVLPFSTFTAQALCNS